MGNNWSINLERCTACGACVDVCPNRILQRDAQQGIFFRTDRLSTCMQCGHCMAVCPTQSVLAAGLCYAHDFFELPEVQDRNGQVFYDLLASRRAVRSFQNKPVPRDLLEKIVQAIRLAPPSFPPIKTRLVVVQDPALIRRALPTMIAFYDRLVTLMHNPVGRRIILARAGKERYTTLKEHVIPLMSKRLPDLKSGTEDTIMRRAPAMILLHANRGAENYRADIYVAATCGLLAAHALGLGGTFIDLVPPAVERSAELRALFSIPQGDEVVSAIIIGYPKYRYQRAIRRELNQVTWL